MRTYCSTMVEDCDSKHTSARLRKRKEQATACEERKAKVRNANRERARQRRLQETTVDRYEMTQLAEACTKQLNVRIMIKSDTQSSHCEHFEILFATFCVYPLMMSM